MSERNKTRLHPLARIDRKPEMSITASVSLLTEYEVLTWLLCFLETVFTVGAYK